MKSNRNSSAGTKADSTTTAEALQVSQTIAKPNVIGCFVFWYSSFKQLKTKINGKFKINF